MLCGYLFVDVSYVYHRPPYGVGAERCFRKWGVGIGVCVCVCAGDIPHYTSPCAVTDTSTLTCVVFSIRFMVASCKLKWSMSMSLFFNTNVLHLQHVFFYSCVRGVLGVLFILLRPRRTSWNHRTYL